MSRRRGVCQRDVAKLLKAAIAAGERVREIVCKDGQIRLLLSRHADDGEDDLDRELREFGAKHGHD